LERDGSSVMLKFVVIQLSWFSRGCERQRAVEDGGGEKERVRLSHQTMGGLVTA